MLSLAGLDLSPLFCLRVDLSAFSFYFCFLVGDRGAQMDSELEEIRRLRLQDLQQSQGKAPGPRNEETEAQKEAAAEEMRRNMVGRQRLDRLRLIPFVDTLAVQVAG